MTRSIADIPLAELDPARTALFLDFDGTLADLAEHPDEVRLAPELVTVLGALHAGFGGALAIVTGREIARVDRFLHPLQMPVAGVHGLVRRDASGAMHDFRNGSGSAMRVADRLAAFVETRPGLLLERKPGSVALHYRGHPESEAECRDVMRQATADLPDMQLIDGKMVIEALHSGASKGRGVADFLDESPFAGRLPVFAGDDVTDESAFAAVNDRGGVSIKVGEGPTAARYRAADAADFRRWLKDLALRLHSGGARERA